MRAGLESTVALSKSILICQFAPLLTLVQVTAVSPRGASAPMAGAVIPTATALVAANRRVSIIDRSARSYLFTAVYLIGKCILIYHSNEARCVNLGENRCPVNAGIGPR